uniref:Uncharacterized protein LOC111124212 n=1 Tax=Crassostrea virginica TaxID=6565 RepID=A0A8B8D5H8_CRAVI|nr:uncharacterized protein LOC111124212 [Crassostrea virginica]
MDTLINLRSTSYCLVKGVSGQRIWTGGNDIALEGSWHWDEGDDLLSYLNWDADNPTNDNGIGDCLELRGDHSWKWNDLECSSVRPFVCELHACHLPDHCITTNCTTTDDYRCIKCKDEGSKANYSLYWPTANKKACEATCSWKENWCWPGTCAAHLAKHCICSTGFYKNSSSPARCQLSKEAHIVTCRLGAESDKGEVGNSTSHGDCEKEESTYINFQPKSLSYTFVTSFEMPNNMPPYPIHINESHFGVVHAEVTLYKEDLKSKLYTVQIHQSNHLWTTVENHTIPICFH